MDFPLHLPEVLGGFLLAISVTTKKLAQVQVVSAAHNVRSLFTRNKLQQHTILKKDGMRTNGEISYVNQTSEMKNKKYEGTKIQKIQKKYKKQRNKTPPCPFPVHTRHTCTIARTHTYPHTRNKKTPTQVKYNINKKERRVSRPREYFDYCCWPVRWINRVLRQQAEFYGERASVSVVDDGHNRHLRGMRLVFIQLRTSIVMARLTRNACDYHE